VTGGWRLAARNLRRNRRRNLATGLAVAFGFAGLAVLGGYLDHVDTFLRTNAVYLQHTGHLTVYHAGGLDKAMSKPSRFSLTPAQQAAVRAAASADSRVAFVAGYLRGMGLASNGCRSVPFLALGIEPETQRRILTDANVLQASGDLVRPIRGRQLYEYPDLDGRVALAAGLAGLLGKMRVHDDLAGRAPAVGLPDCSKADAAASFSADANLQLAGITFDGSLAATDSEVVNLFHTPTAETDDQVLYATLPALQRLYDTDAVSYIAVFLKDWRDAAPVAHDLRARLRDAGVPADVYEFTDERVSPYYVGSMVFLRSMGGFIVLIVASVVVLGVMNSTTLTVYERSRELGTLRAVGYTRPQVRGLVIREVALLALLGVCAGIALAYIAAGAVSLADVRINPPGTPGTMRVVLTPGVRVVLWLVALLVPLSLAVAWAVAGRRLRERTSDLLIATNV
jgi:putative ABC transport system permease protein